MGPLSIMADTADMNAARRYGVIVVAAGRGERAGASAEGPKQYRSIGGRPVLVYTLQMFLQHPLVAQIVVVIHPDDERFYETAIAQLADAKALLKVHGGATRQASVLHGLRALDDADVTHVLIHDAVRPFVSAEMIARIDEAFAAGAEAVLPALPITDTLKRAAMGESVEATVPRAGLFAAQTPQAFTRQSILAAHQEAAISGQKEFTDDASIAEATGTLVRLIPGEADNVKLTTAHDIEMADRRLTATGLPDVRTGNGYDVHRLVDGDGVTLCGVFIPHDQALDGHSDADVGLHALTDALLATCGAGDIGDHFPPSDPQWKGAASRLFVEHAARIVRDAGGIITNADVSLIAEAPRIGPHRDAMRATMAEMLGISAERCSVKATTNEMIGFVGRREGIAAIATATVVYRRPSK
ncbi:MAG TPA: bifunctional 2-C-methyl-D-erythritol 4-phosphate cytidylyltransferase/2-C-methyl-D-erythritol 2,4-cyclodiphosphate synthase [Pararhizobium sp.]|nr:bifunctional 2-C-methyl-D-erythritol 4-phosphate cytidylyltransferase/2-C-methyl-D-erythritol 2,4-cyclodiphosphate synthase [Pararhizobium sp.]